MNPDTQFGEMKNKFFTKKSIIAILSFLIMVLMIPIGMKMLSETQIFKSKASTADAITFPETETQSCSSEGVCTTSSDTVIVDLVSTLGPPVASSQSGGQ